MRFLVPEAVMRMRRRRIGNRSLYNDRGATNMNNGHEREARPEAERIVLTNKA